MKTLAKAIGETSGFLFGPNSQNGDCSKTWMIGQ